MSEPRPFAVVAIPAHDEAERIGACLAALAVQRDRFGAPLPVGAFEVLVFANNCADMTVAVAEAMARHSPAPIRVVAEALPPDRSHAGAARRRAMDLAAARVEGSGRPDGVILTTDADTRVGSTWIDATLCAFTEGADAVAGYVDADAEELMRLGAEFVRRGRLEETYQRAIAEIDALCDPRAGDPWPNHRVSAGASLAVTLQAYRAIGGLPAMATGEDMALTRALDRAGFRVRHSMEVVVSTSCRFDGRVPHGAGETMRLRHGDPEAPCDDDLEPAFHTVRRALAKGRLRVASTDGTLADRLWVTRFGLSAAAAEAAMAAWRAGGFDDFWSVLSASSPRLRAPRPLRPADLPHQIRRAAMCLRLLRSGRPQADRRSSR